MGAEREHEIEAVPATSLPAPAAVAAAPVGNRALGALLARRADGLPRGVAHPRIAGALARRRVLARAPTREEMLTAFQRELADATAGSGAWKDVVLRLNGFDKADIVRLAGKMSVDQLRSARAAAERDFPGWPLDHVINRLDDAALQQGARLRPLSGTIWTAYARVSYDVFSGPDAKYEVWEFIGGSVGKGFDGENTCATRVSYAFNYGGFQVRGAEKNWSYFNDPKVFHGRGAGDGRQYIVSAPYLAKFLRDKWGKPDATLKTNDEAKDFEKTLVAGQVAVFSGPHHAGLFKPGYSDAYVKSDPDVMPVDVWRLPL